MDDFCSWIDKWIPFNKSILQIERKQEVDEFFHEILSGYEKEIRVSKKVFFYSFIFLLVFLVSVALYVRSDYVNGVGLFVLLIFISISSALSFMSVFCYCQAKSSWLLWKQRESE